jgi:hypothetical protein
MILSAIGLFATALLLGTMVFFAGGVTPLVFRGLPPEQAGPLIRRLFPVYYLWLLALSAAGAIALLPVRPMEAGLLAAIAGMTIWLRQVLMPRINALREAAQAGNEEAGRGFRLAHRLSVAANLMQMLAAAVVLARFAV